VFYVYVLQAKKEASKFYIGSTRDLKRRFKEHNEGRSTWTRGHEWRLVYYEAYATASAARKREHVLKLDGRSRRALMQRIEADLPTEDE